jgi:pyruvate dehydrogenase (quinone)
LNGWFLAPAHSCISQARGVQIDVDGKMLGIRYPMEVRLEGDSAETLRALAPLLERKADRSWREQLEKSIEQWWQVVEQRSMSEADPINQPSRSSTGVRLVLA